MSPFKWSILAAVILLAVVAGGAYLLSPRGDFDVRDAAVAATEDELYDLIPPELRYEADPPPESDNAHPLWAEAFSIAAGIDDEPWQDLLHDWETDLLATEREKDRLPEGESREAMLQWLAEYEVVFEMLAEALKRPEAYIPDDALPPEEFPWEWSWARGFRAMASITNLHMRLAVMEGDVATAMEKGELLLRTANRVLEADAFMIHQLLAGSVSAAVTPHLVHLAAHPDTTEAQRRDLLKLFDPSTSSLPAITQAANREFNQLVPMLVEIAEDIRRGRSMHDDDIEMFPDEAALLERMWRYGYAPLDTQQTVLEASRRLQELMQMLQRHGARTEVGQWRDELVETRDRLNEIADRAMERGRLPRPRHERHNLYGRQILLDTILVGSSTATTVLRHDARMRVAHLGVALCIYEKEHASLPGALDDLVAAGLIEAVPRDPFDGEALRYSPRHRVVWSVGQMGPDHIRDGIEQEDLDRYLDTSQASIILPAIGE